MTPEQAYKIFSDESEAYAEAIVGRPSDRDDYCIDLFRPGNSAELYLAQQTLLMHYKELLKEVQNVKPNAA
jgi:hypothetical protein